MFAILSLILGAVVAAPPETLPVELRPIEAESRIEVRVGGSLFTAYQYGPKYPDKPVFYPVISRGGSRITREYPLVRSQSGGGDDHPHHQSVFLGYGDVNGLDFWSHAKGEKLVHKAVVDLKSGPTGQLAVLIDWQDAQGKVLLRELRRVTFGGTGDSAWMDHDITLIADETPLTFGDTKEGMFALRLTNALREEEGSGRYLNAYGAETSTVIWGKRAPWVALAGVVENEPVTVAIFDHPSSENYPAYWHARGYGLFAVNPFGRKDFAPGTEPLNRRVPAYGQIHFRYRIVVYSGKVEKARLDGDYWDYTK